AEAEARNEPFDLDVLDCQMPEMDGLALAREIRERTGGRTPPMILLSSHNARPSSDQLKDSGAATCLFKPVRKAALIEALRSIFEKAPDAPPPEPDATTEASLRSARVLVAEDNAVNRKVALLLLKSLGYA